MNQSEEAFDTAMLNTYQKMGNAFNNAPPALRKQAVMGVMMSDVDNLVDLCSKAFGVPKSQQVFMTVTGTLMDRLQAHMVQG